MVPATTDPPDHQRRANCVALDGAPGPTMVAMDGSLCRKWSPGRKPAHGGDNSWLATLFNNNTMHGRLLQ